MVIDAIQGDSLREAGEAASLEHAIRLACDIVAGMDSRSVRSARVVGGRRLAASEILRAQAIASERAVRLTMNGHGTVAIRRTGQATVPAPAVNADWFDFTRFWAIVQRTCAAASIQQRERAR